MNNTNQPFASVYEHNVQIPNDFINSIIANRETIRQYHYLVISSQDLVWLNGQNDGYILVQSSGDDLINCYLCRYQGNLHFVFQSYTGNDTNPYIYSARETFKFEVDDLLYSDGGGIISANGQIQQYEEIVGPRQIPQFHDEFDFDALLMVGRRSRSDDGEIFTNKVHRTK
jgi:hypothetical protein